MSTHVNGSFTPSSRIRKIAEALGKAKGHGSQWQCLCPAHEDREPSLSLTERDGQILFKCHAGCSQPSVLAELRKRDLWGAREHSEVLDACYSYRDESGKLLFQKIRKPGKRFICRRPDATGGWIWSLKGIRPPLFNLPAVLRAKAEGSPIAILEGEKDCQCFENLTGIVATCNFDGAGGKAKWRSDYTEVLAGADVILLYDHDEPGRLHRDAIMRALRNRVKSLAVVHLPSELNGSPIKDFSDWVTAGGTKAAFSDLPRDCLTRTAGAEAARNTKATERASSADYIALVLDCSTVADIRRELLTDELMVQFRDGSWQSFHNVLPYFRSYAREASKRYVLEAIPEHLERYKRDSLEPRLLLDIPSWDGVDRIAEIAHTLRFLNVSAETFYQLISAWGAGIFKRTKDHTVQPCMPLFIGPQGCGKDVLISALTGGLDSYVKPLNLAGFGLKEAEAQLHTALVFKIEEFSRVAHQSPVLKHLISTDETAVRLSYDRRDQKRKIRCSFIGSDNERNPLSDYTGNRRFWVFNAEFMGIETSSGKVTQSYPGMYCRPKFREERLQILAQFKRLAEDGFAPSLAALADIRRYMHEITPPDPNELIIEAFDAAVLRIMCAPYRWSTVDGAPLYSIEQLGGVLTQLQKDFQKTRITILRVLADHGRREKHRDKNLYRGAGGGCGGSVEGEAYA